MVTANEINVYLYNIRNAFVDYGYALSRYQKLGRKEIECYKLRFELLNHYVRIITDYLDRGADYDTKNFFTTAEARDIIQHINNLTGTNYMLDL